MDVDELENYVESTARLVERLEGIKQEVWYANFDFTQTRYMDYYTESKSEMY